MKQTGNKQTNAKQTNKSKAQTKSKTSQSKTNQKQTKSSKSTKTKAKQPAKAKQSTNSVKANPKDPTKHPIVTTYQQQVREAIEDIYTHYSNHMPEAKRKQIERLEANIYQAPYWLQNLLPPEYKQYRVDKHDPYTGPLTDNSQWL